MPADDFASLFEGATDPTHRSGPERLRPGQKVEGTVLAISGGLVLVDIGQTADASLELTEFDDRPVAVGDRITATVVQPRKEGALLTRSLGKGGGEVSSDVIRLASESGAPVSGTVTAAVKGGFSVDVAGTRAFCPISQIDLSYVAEPEAFVGQTYDFRVLEFKEGGRNVVLSRRKLLEEERQATQARLAETLSVGSTVEGTVKSTVKGGVIVDLGGLDGFVPISELSPMRVESPLDIVSIGESVQAQVLSLEQTDRGLNVRLSIKATRAPTSTKANPDEVLAAEVIRHVHGGLIVSTSQGEGLVPTRELALPPGGDHRRTYPIGLQLDVVLVNRDAQSGKNRFSVNRVAHVQERKNYQDYGNSAQKQGSLGSLGDVMGKKLEQLGSTSAAPRPGKQAKAPQAKNVSEPDLSHPRDKSPTDSEGPAASPPRPMVRPGVTRRRR